MIIDVKSVSLKVRARAVDMLGRQQIAGIPTAIHELLKNAHDAYAEKAELDYFRKTKTLVLRDDGYGMTRKDVETHWLALGTESRLNSNQEENPWTGPKNLPRRSITGEKGIGRLAIAVIAPITLLMTRAIRQKTGLHDLVVTLVHWGIFEQPGLDISQIKIPIIEIPDGGLPTSTDIKHLLKKVSNNIETLKDDFIPAVYERLKEEINSIKIAPDEMDKFFDENQDHSLSLKGDGYGTHFVMIPTKAELCDDIDGKEEGEASPLETNLLGFSNTISGAKPVLLTSFRDHGLDGTTNERIAARNFLLPEDFTKGDHQVEGSFDEFGQFNGKISIYKKDPIEFVCNWPKGRGKQTKCGPFKIKFSYLNGDAKDSLLPPDQHLTLKKKLDRVGGLYIYKDGIRVLPYGSADYDFLEIEKRRTKSAQDWFFSYRRLIGYIDISNKTNNTLVEKAGREGFSQNIAYRHFRDVLKNLFERLALEFFRPKSPQSEHFWDRKNAVEAEQKALKRQKKKADERREDFGNVLKKFFDHYEKDIFKEQSQKILSDSVNKLSSIAELDDKGELVSELGKLTDTYQSELRKLEKEIIITKPRGLALSSDLEKDWNAYCRIFPSIKDDFIVAVRKDLSQNVSILQKDNVGKAEIRENAILEITNERDVLVKELSSFKTQAYNSTEQMQKALRETIRAEFSDFKASIENIILEFTRASAKNPENISALRSKIESEFISLRNHDVALFESIKRNMDDLAEDLKEGQTSDDRVGALEQELVRLDEKLEFYNDFAQVGMSVGILQHEFEKSAHDLRRSMRDLKPWADGTKGLKVIYKQMLNSFNHLDGYLNMLDPLGRRSVRRKTKINGDAIRVHLKRIFGKKLEDENIVLEVSDEFNAKVVKCYSAALLGAFVNVIDNAIYWVANGADKNKKIMLSTDDHGFLISNTGPGIEDRYKDRIFDFGESTKPKGKGLGLSISKDTLLREGFDIELIQVGRDKNPVFRICTELGEKNDGG